jgi:hypothetical protein
MRNERMIMRRQCIVLTGLVIGFMLLAGCADSLSRLEVDYGTSHALARVNQTLDPEAGKRAGPACRLDGQAAQEAVERYRKGFGSQSAAPANSLIGK